MGDEEESNGGGRAAKRGHLRIYVGGLGGNVSADDLRKTFTSPQLGDVESVEIVRTKGRSFAYLDFIPVSDKGLAKLFSMYNGCMWKGGKLRLEKAKEHYLIRMKHEWAKDAELSHDSHNHDTDIVKNFLSTEKLVKVHKVEDGHLRIFFPNLRKVKPLPFKGTGKHKRSFQHIPVPYLPTHFCDCEEHSISPEAAQEELSCHQEKDSGEMNDEELCMMSSVMCKIFEREKCSQTAVSTLRIGSEAETPIKSPNVALDVTNLADEVSDEDNLVINIVAGSNNRTSLSDNWRQKAANVTKDLQVSKSCHVQRKRSEGKQMVPFNKKRKEPLGEYGHTGGIVSDYTEKEAIVHKGSDDFVSILDTQPREPKSDVMDSTSKNRQSKKSACRDIFGRRDYATFHISDILSNDTPAREVLSVSNSSEKSSEQERQKMEAPQEEANNFTKSAFDDPNEAVDKPAKITSWQQKSSWVQLVSSSSNNSFSISQILPSLNLEKQELPQCKGTDNSVPNRMLPSFVNSDRSVISGDISRPNTNKGIDFSASDAPEYALADSGPCHPGEVSDQPNPMNLCGADNEASSSLSKKHPLQTKKTSLGSTDGSRALSFIRSAASMKEWTKTKAALSGYLKKKDAEK